MKPGRALQQYFKQRVIAIEALLKKPDKKFTKEDFHELRVEIKKLRALIELLAFCTKNFESEIIFKPVKKIFKQAGKVREIQLEKTSFNRYKTHAQVKAYLRKLHPKELKAKTNFSAAYKIAPYRLAKMYAHIIPAIKKVHGSDVKKYITQKEKEIKKLLHSKKIKSEQMHALRSMLKEWHYNIKSLDVKTSDNAFKNVDSLQDLIGKWHDIRIIKRHLEKAVKKQLTLQTKPILEICHRLNLREQNLRKEINAERRKQ